MILLARCADADSLDGRMESLSAGFELSSGTNFTEVVTGGRFAQELAAAQSVYNINTDQIHRHLLTYC